MLLQLPNLRSRLLSTIAALLLPLVAIGQPQERLWQKLVTFPQSILTVHFLPLSGPPSIGMVGCDGAVYRTTDGGETWIQATCIASIPNDPIKACDFTFKDSLLGWFANADAKAIHPYYSTSDGGVTWVGGTAPTLYCSAIYYNPRSARLFLSGREVTGQSHSSCWSTDDGATWRVFESNISLNGYAFLDADHGITTNFGSGYYQNTTNGGITWSRVNGGVNECWQPAADAAKQMLWAAGELHNTLDKSTDGGLSFADVAVNFHSTGTLRTGGCSALYTQRTPTFADSIEGIVVSQDGGMTWLPLLDKANRTGPHIEVDRRFYVQGTYVYAPSGSNEIWRYIGDSTKYGASSGPIPLATQRELHIYASDCAPITKPIYLEYLNDCNDALLTSAEIVPVGRFQLIGLKLPMRISGDVPLAIEHDPLFRTPDTAQLRLVFSINGGVSYDTVLLTNAIAGAQYKPRVEVRVNGQTNATLKAGDTASVSFTLLDPLPKSLEMDSLSIETNFDSTMLEVSGAYVALPFALLREEHSLGTQNIVLRAPKSDIAANTLLTILNYRTLLNTNPIAHYHITELRFNDSVFNGCVSTPSVSPSDLTITLLGCGDSTLRAFIQGESLINILSIHSTSVRLRTDREVSANIALYNTLGQRVIQFDRPLLAGTQDIPLPTLHSGMYTLEVSALVGRAVARYVVMQ